ncbi:orotate phosphoribosyltransferase [Betaproteobacteria bacterium]|nr:orotate phosphoribosyltransferase [Betaproteobacteria bacterium]GHU23789.1 orotate phosphoribosyltransferase [Betaproteobacteria bacterium]
MSVETAQGADFGQADFGQTDFSRNFIALACHKGGLRFGSFVTKAGRQSPYFFNAGLFDDGASFRALCGYYAAAIEASGIGFDMLFGPAYKGIPLVTGTAIRLAETGTGIPFAFNRKEAKDHGEGGTLIGAPLAGSVLIVDDVISAGTSVRESVDIIRRAGAVPAGVVIALDRMELGQGTVSATEEVSATYGIPVVAVATLDDLITYLAGSPEIGAHLDAVKAYREAYGVRSTD